MLSIKVALPYYNITLRYDRHNLRQDRCENRNTACRGESVLLETFFQALVINDSVLLLWEANDGGCDLTTGFISVAVRSDIGLWPSLTRIRGRTHWAQNTLEEWSGRRQELYRTTYNTHRRKTSTPQTGFEPKMTACERPQTQPDSTMPLRLEIKGITFTYKYCSFITFWKTHIQVLLTFQNVTAEGARNPYLSKFIQNKLDDRTTD
jgi:hypothetical protein